jgi:hypothetical protein
LLPFESLVSVGLKLLIVEETGVSFFINNSQFSSDRKSGCLHATENGIITPSLKVKYYNLIKLSKT